MKKKRTRTPTTDTLPPSPYDELTRDRAIEMMANAADDRNPMPRIVPVIYILGSDGEYHHEMPTGVTSLHQTKIMGYCWQDHDGVRFGQHAASEQELIDRWNTARDNDHGHFVREMSKRPLHELGDAWRYWLRTEPPRIVKD